MYKDNIVTQIVAVNNIGFIGKDNNLMWYNKEDLQHFKSVTKWNVLIAGRKTVESLPKAVHKGRWIIEVSRNGNSIEKAFEIADREANENNIYVIGGGEIYKATQEQTDFILLSRIDNNDEGDTTFEIPDEFELITTHKKDNTGADAFYQIEIYKRKTAFFNLEVKSNDECSISPDQPILTGSFELS